MASGDVFIWEERGPHSEHTGMGIERWTDGRSWGPSRVRDEFLYYSEKTPEDTSARNEQRAVQRSRGRRPNGSALHEPAVDRWVKQTYSVHLRLFDDPENAPPRKWHLTAYYTTATCHLLRTVDDIPELRNLVVPEGLYVKARQTKFIPRPRQRREDLRNSPPEEYDRRTRSSSGEADEATWTPIVYAPFNNDQQSALPPVNRSRGFAGVPVGAPLLPKSPSASRSPPRHYSTDSPMSSPHSDIGMFSPRPLTSPVVPSQSHRAPTARPRLPPPPTLSLHTPYALGPYTSLHDRPQQFPPIAVPPPRHSIAVNRAFSPRRMSIDSTPSTSSSSSSLGNFTLELPAPGAPVSILRNFLSGSHSRCPPSPPGRESMPKRLIISRRMEDEQALRALSGFKN